MFSQEAERFHELLKKWATDAAADPSPEGFRLSSRTLFAALGRSFDPILSPVAKEKVRGVWADKSGVEPGENIVLFLHGGGFQSGSAETHARYAIEFARLVNGRALLADYRLMPEYGYPTQIEDCCDLYAWLLETGVDPSRVVFVGESAGGNLVFTVQLEALRRGLMVPGCAYAMSPWLDFEALGQSYLANADTDLVSGAETTRFLGQLYVGEGGDVRHASPLHADLSGMAPAFVQTGGDEVLVSDTLDIVARLREAGVVAEADIVPRMQHMFQFEAGVMPEATNALEKAAQFVSRFLPNR